MTTKPHPQSILLRLSDVSDANVSTGHRSAYVTTTLPAIVQGLRNLECQPDPFNEFQGPDALFTRLLAGIVGTTEYDAVMGNDVERLNALLAEHVEKVATLTRERDEARRRLDAVASISHDGGLLNMTEADVCVAVRRLSIPNWSADSIQDRERRVADSCRIADKTYRERVTPTPGAQA